MSTHNIVFYEDLTKIIFELSSNIIKYAPYFFCCHSDCLPRQDCPITINVWEYTVLSENIVCTGLPHYNSLHYNTDFNITRSCIGSQMAIFLITSL